MTRGHTRRSLLILALAVVVAAGGGYLAYELGRFHAGYSLFDQRRAAGRYERAIAERDAEIEELRRREAILETSSEIDSETYARVEDELDRLQRRIQAQEEELAFYRGIVTPEDGVSGLKIQSLEVEPMDAERHHVLRLVLVQAIVHNERVRGEVLIRLAGRMDGEPASYGLDEIGVEGVEGGVGSLSYDFRYFQGLERELALPVGFEPDTVGVEIRPREPDGDPVTRDFAWETVAG